MYLISGFFVFFLVDGLGGWNQQMWLVSCRRQGMLTQGPEPDPKCKLIISSFFTLPHLLDCLNFTRNAMSIVLSLQMLGGCNSWGGLIYIRVWVGGQGVGGGTGGGYHLIVFFLVLLYLFPHVLSPFI